MIELQTRGRTKPKTIREREAVETPTEKGLIKKLKERWRTNYALLLSTGCPVFGRHKQR